MTAAGFLVKDLLAVLDAIAPFGLAEKWDNVGLMAGDPNQPVRGVLAALDPAEDLLREAEAIGTNVILTHHPLIFHPLKSIRLDQPIGRFLAAALRQETAVIGCHTNLDVIRQGVSDELAARLGLVASEPLADFERSGEGTEPSIGFGRLGRYPDSLSGPEFLERIFTGLEVAAVQVAGRLPERIDTVAVCGGSGSGLVETAWRLGAQVLVTGEVKHSEARWAEASGFCVIDAGHYPTENVVIPALVSRLQQELAGRGLVLQVRASGTQKAPLVYRTPQAGSAPEAIRKQVFC
jgi:dinuclear metal center YbgI/SA1388 family protein